MRVSPKDMSNQTERYSEVVYGKVRVRLVRHGKSYRVCQSVGYGYGSRTELT